MASSIQRSPQQIRANWIDWWYLSDVGQSRQTTTWLGSDHDEIIAVCFAPYTNTGLCTHIQADQANGLSTFTFGKCWLNCHVPSIWSRSNKFTSLVAHFAEYIHMTMHSHPGQLGQQIVSGLTSAQVGKPPHAHDLIKIRLWLVWICFPW